MRCIRVQAIVNEEFGFLDKHKMKVDSLRYFCEKAKLKYHKWDCVYQHFEKFVNGYLGFSCMFKGLTRAVINQPLKQLISEARIRRYIIFHCFKYSYAVIQISSGTDIYTVSKMLTHKNVTTTQIYADLVNSKKRETANKISLK